MRPHVLAHILIVVVITFVSVTEAWVGPTAPPPERNVSAPLNVGTVSQIKDGTLGLNGLTIFGNMLVHGISRYLNFGSTVGSDGYGIRDNAGTMQLKSSGGKWVSLPSCVSDGATLAWSAQAESWVCVEPAVINIASCKTILDSGGSVGSGIYTIDPDGVGGSPGFSVYCDMAFAGGGWTRVALNGLTSNNSLYRAAGWTNGTGSNDSPITAGHISKAFHTLTAYTEIYKDGTFPGGGNVAACGASMSVASRLTGADCMPVAVAGYTARRIYFNIRNGSCGDTRVATGYQSYDNGTSYYYLGLGEEGSVMRGSCYGPPTGNAGSLFVR